MDNSDKNNVDGKNDFNLEDFLSSVNIEIENFSFEKFITEDDKIVAGSPFNVENSNYTRAYLTKLVEKSLIKDFEMGAEMDELTQKRMINLANLALDFKIDSTTGKVYYELEGIKTYIDIEADELLQKKTVADLLPEVKFDVIQNGILERSREAEAIYKVLVLNNIYGGIWTKLIKSTLRVYDTANLSIKEGETGLNFCDLLKLMQEESGPAFRILSDACNLKLSELKTKKELRLYADFTNGENQLLRQLKIAIAQNRDDYKVIIDSKPTKAQREVEREKMKAKEDVIINESPVGVLYRILNLSSRDIPDIPFNQINRLADDLAIQITLKEGLSNYPSVTADIKRKLKRRAYREFLYVYKDELKSQWRNNIPIDFKLLLKDVSPPSDLFD